MKKDFLKIKSNQSGFTLAELMIATGVLVIAFLGVMVTFMRCMDLSEMSQNTSLALSAAKNQMELIKNTDYVNIVGNYDGDTFSTGSLNGMGVSYVDDTDPDLLEVTVSVSWRQKNGRIVGEDTNLNGSIDSGEDVSGNGMLDSKVQLVTRVFNE